MDQNILEMIKQLPSPWQFNQSDQEPVQWVDSDQDDDEMPELEENFINVATQMDQLD